MNKSDDQYGRSNKSTQVCVVYKVLQNPFESLFQGACRSGTGCKYNICVGNKIA